MARKKTKKEKVSINKRRASAPVYVFKDEETKSKNKPKKKVAKPVSSQAIYNYDPLLILKDLRKTVLLSAVMFIILFSLYFAGQSNLIPLFN